MSNNTTFQQYLQSAYTSGPLSTDEVIEFVLPVFEEVLSFHENGQVGSFEKSDSIFISNGRLDIDENCTHPPQLNLSALKQLLEYQQVTGYTITEKVLEDIDITKSKVSTINLQVSANPNEALTHPVYFPGFQCYEIKIGHHDAQTDIFCLGLILASAVMGLDLYDLEDLNQFASYRNQPAGLNSRMHPTLCGLVTEMTELNRNNRSRDLQEIVQRLKHYRDYDPQREVDLSKLADLQNKKSADRRTFILSKLRNRLFDTTRRNRLLFYKSNTRFVNLTVSSVPLVLHYQSINPQLLFTWNDEISKQIIAQKDLSLNKYLRFEDHPYLNSQLNTIRLQTENDKKEYGFSQLKLVVAFLHWHNLKEDINERIQSPLLLLPVELERKKSLKEERFSIKIIDNAALINPILSNHLKDLYGIELPESIDFDDVSMKDFFELLESKINTAKQGVKLNYIDKPRIKIVHSIARQTINNYRKKLKIKKGPTFHQIDYSYSEENYKPLGLELFRQKIQPKQSTLEFLLNETPVVGTSNNLAPTKEENVKGTFHLSDGESNPYSWDFDICNIVLGNFNYKKMSLVSDYNKVTDQGIQHAVFTELFNNEPKQTEDAIIENKVSEWYHVINADPTQSKAVIQSRLGKSYIIQGPPGTGKSQTITNLIADFLAQGKSILFVCEKRAALDVVYHRLQQNKLSELCCYIHDSQGDKKEFYKDLRTVYEDFLKNKMDVTAISQQRSYILNQLLEAVEVLNKYHETQRMIQTEAGVSTRELIEKLVRLKPFIPGKEISDNDEIPYYNQWIQYGQAIEELGHALEQTGADSELAKHPFSNLGLYIINSENPFTLIDNVVNHSLELLKNLSKVISEHNIPSQFTNELNEIKRLIEDSIELFPIAESQNLKLIDDNNDEAKTFQKLFIDFKTLQNEYKKATENNNRWKNKFEKQDLQQALSLAEKNEKSFFSFFNGSWRRLKKQLNKSYDFSAHQIRPAYVLILQQLQSEYKSEENVLKSQDVIQKKYHVDNIDSLNKGIDLIRKKQGVKEVDYLLQHPQSNQLVSQLSLLNNTFQQLDIQLKQCLFYSKEKAIRKITDELESIKINKQALKDLLPSLRKFSLLPESLQLLIRKIPITPIQAEALMANRTLQKQFDTNQIFACTSQRMIADTVNQIEKLYKELLEINSNYIRAIRRQKFLLQYDLSNTSTTVLQQDQKRIKKIYTDGRKVLEHEMGKTLRYKSIREIASNQSGVVLKDIKPVWLMSPLSVSDSLPLDIHFFDVVIFDEASQITLEEGIPALFRAPQTIIVGDDKQMPPSNFFNAKSGDPEDLEKVEGESEDEILSTDSDSLLVQGSRKLNSTMLSWHYRSRYETLISYSNYAFYNAGLLTIPDKTIHHFDYSGHTIPLIPEHTIPLIPAILYHPFL